MAFHGLYFSPKSDVAASFQPTVAAVANWSPDAAASQEPAVAAAAKLSSDSTVGNKLQTCLWWCRAKFLSFRRCRKLWKSLTCSSLTRLSSPNAETGTAHRQSCRCARGVANTSPSGPAHHDHRCPSCDATPSTNHPDRSKDGGGPPVANVPEGAKDD